MKKVALAVLVLVVMSFVLGCTQRVTDFTVISTKNTNVVSYKEGPRIQGKDCGYMILSIPVSSPDMKEAIDKAIENAGPGYDALIDGVVYYTQLWAVVFWEFCYVVEGTPISTRQSSADILNELELDGRIIYHSKLEIENDYENNLSFVECDACFK